MKKLYELDMGDGVICAVAESIDKAAEYLWKSEGVSDCYESKAEVRDQITIRRNVVPQTMRVGAVTDFYKGLKLGFYKFLIECPCEKCGKDDTLSLVKGKAICSNCDTRSAPNKSCANVSQVKNG